MSAYTLFPVLTFPQSPVWLLLVHCRAAPDNMVHSALYLVWQVCVVKVFVRGSREGLRQDIHRRLVRHSLYVGFGRELRGRQIQP